jgi:hypothetical protein
MTRTACALLAGLLVVAGVRADDKGTVVKFDNLQSTAPAGWKAEKPPESSIIKRYAQFRLPRVEGDPADGELIIWKDLGGRAVDNVNRWKNQFRPPEGKSIDDVAKVTEFKVSGSMVTMLDIHGTYLDGPPNQPPAQKKPRANYRMLAVQFEGPDSPYHVILRGPAKTIDKSARDFESWIKGFK